MSHHEDDKPLAPVPAMRPEPLDDPEAFVDTEPPTGTGHDTPVDYTGFPRPPRTGDPVLDTLLGVVTELRDSVQSLGRAVSTLNGRVAGMENAVERRRLTDGANHESMRMAIHNMGTAVEGLCGEVSNRFLDLESRIAKLEEWRDSQQANNGSG